MSSRKVALNPTWPNLVMAVAVLVFWAFMLFQIQQCAHADMERSKILMEIIRCQTDPRRGNALPR